LAQSIPYTRAMKSIRMIYRAAILSIVLLAGMNFTIPAHAARGQSWVFKGTCSKGDIAQSDGVQTGAASGMMNTKDYFALMKRAKSAHLTLGSDGFLWTIKQLKCDSAIVWVQANAKGDTLVSFSNGDLSKPILGFTGIPIDGNGPLFFSDAVYLGDGKPATLLNPNGNGQSCHFYFSDHGTFTQGWEHRLTAIECNVRVKMQNGYLINASATFDVVQAPISHPSRDPAIDHP